jgi:hypothetical protein
MINNFINQIKMVFASPEKRLVIQTHMLADETINVFNDLTDIIKKGEYVIHKTVNIFYGTILTPRLTKTLIAIRIQNGRCGS